MSILDIQVVNLGIYPNDGTGDDLRTAFVKANANFTSIDDHVILDGVSLGNGVPVFNNKLGNNLQFRSLESANANMVISYDSGKISLNIVDSINSVEEDISPALGGILNLNNHGIVGFGSININGTISAPVFTGNVIGNLTGNVTGNLNGEFVGDFTGNLTGTVSDISNHAISELSDVSGDIPIIGQTLSWTGNHWAPSGIALNNLTNVRLNNPIENQVLQYNGTEWINSSVTSVPVDTIQDFDFGVLGKNITNPLELLLQATQVDFNDGYSLDLQALIYLLTRSSATVIEGESVTIELIANVPDGTIFPYTISGISPTDLTNTGLTGFFVVYSGMASLTLITTIDSMEGDEVLTLTLDNILPVVSVSVTIIEVGINGGGPTSISDSTVDGGGPTSISDSTVDGGVILA